MSFSLSDKATDTAIVAKRDQDARMRFEDDNVPLPPQKPRPYRSTNKTLLRRPIAYSSP